MIYSLLRGGRIGILKLTHHFPMVCHLLPRIIQLKLGLGLRSEESCIPGLILLKIVTLIENQKLLIKLRLDAFAVSCGTLSMDDFIPSPTEEVQNSKIYTENI
ncbi:hypothetical protein TNIN_272731 [Trichonephila inaurata madagascariensis]|uniref:Uncharacterized protein n=1 Tax=Trichonephila inaurata madagascariensis TaxID=2747483 RepID=A0A8X6XZZ4_9ARAC|nr:hypothetical protein TNIN_272731 [Trichonephila inaurata madagascariensis]